MKAYCPRKERVHMQVNTLTKSIRTISLIGLIGVFPTSFAATESNPVPVDEVRRFSTAISQIKSYYVKPVSDKKIFQGALKGMLANLDPHSAYLDEEDFNDLKTATKGEFGGLGIEVTMEDGVIKVITPLDDTPASKAGIQAGDYIIRIDKTLVKGLSLKEAVAKMRGKKGTEIKLTVIRKTAKKNPLQLTLVRDEIKIKSVKSKLIQDQYGYIRISHFQALTGQDLLQAVDKLKKQSNDQLQGVVLDLRNNPGGLLDTAIEVSDAFIDGDNEKLIVYTKGRLPGSKFSAIAKPGDVLKGAPIVVLINGGSASGSEIVAGALKENHRAILMGTKTFGKGSVQTVLPLDDKHGIKLTTALYYTPLGNSIQAKGISPDVIVDRVKLEKADKENADSNYALLSEADLKGHLENQQIKQNANKQKSDLIHDDYQLYQAITLLKGMSLARK